MTMIHGNVLESRDLDSYEGFDICMFIVENPYDDRYPEYENAIWVTVVFDAIKENVTLGSYTVNNVLHFLSDKTQHAFNQVNTLVGRIEAASEATAFLEAVCGALLDDIDDV